jgi:hypothetical protein
VNQDTEHTWPPPPVSAEVDYLAFRTPSVDLSISGDVLTFRMLFIRRFVIRFGWAIALVIPLLLVSQFLDIFQSGSTPTSAQLGPALMLRMRLMLPFIGIVAATIAFLWFVFETMLLRGSFRFNRATHRFHAGLLPHSMNGLTYISIRRQVSRTRTWTRCCFYLGFDHPAAVSLDRFNPLHRLVSIYGDARRNEYYLGYITDPEAATRVGHSIARFVGVEYRPADRE